MIKPASLRAHLVAVLPDLARDADRLLVFIDAGSLVSTFQPALSFEYKYTLNLILTDYAGHPDSVMLPLLAMGAGQSGRAAFQPCAPWRDRLRSRHPRQRCRGSVD